MIYKKLQDIISVVSQRNSDLSIENVMGINIAKYFMPSVANVIDTDLTKYKVVSKGMFACNRMHVGRDESLPIAYYSEENPAIVSPAYDVFKIRDENLVLPEYLLLYFSRSEFDREAWFHTDADVRAGLGWQDLVNMKVPIPTIEEQKEIVKKYKVITDRINVLTDINQKLEEMALVAFKKFYKGKTENNEIGDIIQEHPKSNVQVGRARQCIKGGYPFFTSGAEVLKYDECLADGRKILLNTGGKADVKFHIGKAAYSTDTWCIKAKNNLTDYLFLFLLNMKSKIDEEYFNGSALRHLQKPKFKTIKMYLPTDTEIEVLNRIFIPLFDMISSNGSEIQVLTEFKEILLPKLMSGETN